MKTAHRRTQIIATRRPVSNLSATRLGLGLALTAGLFCPRPASATFALTLTGISVFSTDSAGNYTSQDLWDTRGAGAYGAWIYDYDGSGSYANGPTSLGNPGINVPLILGDHSFLIYAQPGADPGTFGLNMFFNSNTASPGISVFNSTYYSGGGTNNTINGSMSTPSMQGPPDTTHVAAANSSAFASNGRAVGISFRWESPSVLNQDHVTGGTTSPGQGNDFIGIVDLSVFTVGNEFNYIGGGTRSTGGTSSDWGTGNNWNATSGNVVIATGVPPANDNPGTANVHFLASNLVYHQPNLNVPWNVASIGFDAAAPAYTIGGQQITIGAGGIINSSANLQTFNNAVVLGNSQAWFAAVGPLLITGPVNLGSHGLVVEGDGNTTITGHISGQFSGITKLGNGTLTLTSANSYLGGTVVSAGLLSAAYAGNDTQSAVGSSDLTIDNIGTVSVDADNALGYNGNEPAITINPSGFLSIGLNHTQHLGSITLSGGTLTSQTPLGVHSFFGIVNLDNNLTAGGSTTTSSIRTGDVALTTPGGTTFTVLPGATSGIDLDVTGDITAPTGVSNTGLIKAGAGVMRLNQVDSYTGGTTVSAGTLAAAYGGNDGQSCVGQSLLTINGGGTVRVDANNALGRGANLPAIVVNAGGTLTVVMFQSQHVMTLTLNGGTLASDTPGASGITFGTFDLDNNLTAGGSTTTSTISAQNIALTTVGGTTFTVIPGAANGIDLDVTGTIGAPGGVTNTALIKTGAGVMRLSNNNTYTGATTISNGTLIVGNGGTTGSLGPGPVTVNSSNSLKFNRSDTVTFSNTVGGTGTIEQIGSGTLTINGVQSWTSSAVFNARSGTTNLASDPGSDTAYTLAVNVTPATGSATVHIAPGPYNGVHLRDLRVNVVGAAGAGLLVIDPARLDAIANPRTQFGGLYGSVALYIGNGAGGSGFASRTTIENLWRSAALEGFWALQNHVGGITSVTRGLTLASGVVTTLRNGLVIVPSVDNANQPATYVGEDIQGDTNGDGKVDINDLGTVLQHLNTTPGSQAGETGYSIYTPAEGDVNGDLVVNINDLGTVLGNLNQVYSPASSGGGVNGVPEPGSVILLALSGAGLVVRRRRDVPGRVGLAGTPVNA